MRSILLIALFISTAICGVGQNTFGVKIYQNTDVFETQYRESGTKEVAKVENVNFGRISFAVDIDTKRGYSHEIEVLIPEISRSIDNVRLPLNYEFRKGEAFDERQ